MQNSEPAAGCLCKGSTQVNVIEQSELPTRGNRVREAGRLDDGRLTGHDQDFAFLSVTGSKRKVTGRVPEYAILKHAPLT